MNQYKYKIDTVLMNSENSTASHPHRLLLNLTHKIDLQRGKKSVVLSNLRIYYIWKK